MKQVIQQAISDTLSDEGFARSGDNWTRSLDETVQLVNLQRSQWSDAYYLNLAVWVKQLGDPPKKLKENLCHIRQRLGGAQLEKALDSEATLDDEKRANAITIALNRRALPFFESCSTIHAIKALLQTKKLDNALVDARVHRLAS